MNVISDEVMQAARLLNMKLHSATELGQRTQWIAEAIAEQVLKHSAVAAEPFGWIKPGAATNEEKYDYGMFAYRQQEDTPVAIYTAPPAPSVAVKALQQLHDAEHAKLGEMLLDKSEDGKSQANWQGGRVNGIAAAISALSEKFDEVPVLTSHEADFCLLVFRAPGAKLNGDGEATHWEDDGSEYGRSVSHWNRPEELGLIACVGGYKWTPTDKLKSVLRSALSAKVQDGLGHEPFGAPGPDAMRVIDPEQWEPCSPDYLKRGGCCASAPRVWNAERLNHYHPKLPATLAKQEG